MIYVILDIYFVVEVLGSKNSNCFISRIIFQLSYQTDTVQLSWHSTTQQYLE